jgi:hypothetical protein
MRTHYALPDEAKQSYIFNPQRSFLSIIVPSATINLVYDPEVRAFGAGRVTETFVNRGLTTVAPDDTRKRRGLYSVHVTNALAEDDGLAYVVQPPLEVGQTYSFSFDQYGPGNYKCYVINRLNNELLSVAPFTGYGFWTRHSTTFHTTEETQVNVFVTTTDGSAGEFWADGFQVERGEPSTFCSGDLREEYAGRAQYGWLGTPHISSSFRLPTARSGGIPIPLNELNFDVYELADWGLPKPDHVFTSYALRHGSYYHRSRISEREVSFTGAIYGTDFRELLCGRNGLANVINPITDRPFRMHFQAFDCDQPLTECVEFDAVYSDGMAGDWKSLNEERVSVTVVMPDPFFYAYGNDGHLLDLYDEVTEEGFGIVGRDGNGVWTPLVGSEPFPTDTFQARGMIVGEDYNLYVVGWDEDNDESLVMRWDGISWSQVGPAWVGKLNCIVWGPSKSIIFAGAVSYPVGDTPTGPQGVWQYFLETDTYELLGDMRFTNVSIEEDGMRAMAMHPDGYLIVGGAFTSATDGVDSLTDSINIACYNFSTAEWEEMAPGLVPKEPSGDPVGAVNAIAIGPDKSVWAGGDFDPVIFGTPTVLARWHFSTRTWYTFENYPMILPPGDVRTLGTIYALTFSSDGDLIVGGNFNTSLYRTESYDDGDPLPLTNLGRIIPSSTLANDYRGDNFFPLQHGTTFVIPPGTVTRPSVFSMTIDCDQILYIGGTFNAVRTALPQSGSGAPTPVNIPAPGIAAMQLSNAKWLRPLTNLKMPESYAPDLIGVLAMTNGGNCNQNRGSGANGLLSIGNPLLTDLGLSTPPGADNTVFAGAFTVVGSLMPIVDIVDVDCAIDVRPILRFTGPGILYGIDNFTNGTAIQFDRVILSDAEVLTVDLSRPRPIAYRSSGSTSGIVAAGSGLSAFRLDAGENRIKATFLSLSDDHTESARSVSLQWRPKYLSIDALCGGC